MTNGPRHSTPFWAGAAGGATVIRLTREGMQPQRKGPKHAHRWRCRMSMAVSVNALDSRSNDAPDEVRTPRKTRLEIVRMEGFTLGRCTFEPGWRRSECIKPLVETWLQGLPQGVTPGRPGGDRSRSRLGLIGMSHLLPHARIAHTGQHYRDGQGLPGRLAAFWLGQWYGLRAGSRRGQCAQRMDCRDRLQGGAPCPPILTGRDIAHLVCGCCPGSPGMLSPRIGTVAVRLASSRNRHW